jgi:thioredoxin-dependent peroxiredoxin
MVDLPKATKGRRMSKKTRKKSSKESPRTSPKTAAKAPARTSSKTSAKTSPKTSPKTPPKTVAKKAAAAKPARGGSKVSAQPPAAKTPKETSKETFKETSKAIAKKSAKAAESSSVEASHKPTSKSLKSNPSKSSPQKPKLSAAPKSEAVTVPESGMVEGAKAPGFQLPRDDGDSVSLADYAGQKLVLFFYPRADTPGCTREAIDFTRLKSAFAESGTAVLGVSGDTVKAQESFRNKHQLSVPLISDEQHGMLEAYGAWGEKSMYGRNFMGIIRTTVLIGADGRIARIWRNVRVDGHAQEVLEVAQTV